MGLRPAPSEIADPEGHARLQKALNAQAKHKKQAQERREQRRYGGAERRLMRGCIRRDAIVPNAVAMLDRRSSPALATSGGSENAF